MQTWPVQDAKARFSELLDTCLRDGPQAVSRRGQEQAVLVPIAEWVRLTQQSQTGVKDLLLAEEARTEYLVPQRGQLKRRKPSDRKADRECNTVSSEVKRQNFYAQISADDYIFMRVKA